MLDISHTTGVFLDHTRYGTRWTGARAFALRRGGRGLLRHWFFNALAWLFWLGQTSDVSYSNAHRDGDGRRCISAIWYRMGAIGGRRCLVSRYHDIGIFTFVSIAVDRQVPAASNFCVGGRANCHRV